MGRRMRPVAHGLDPAAFGTSGLAHRTIVLHIRANLPLTIPEAAGHYRGRTDQTMGARGEETSGTTRRHEGQHRRRDPRLL
jgi:hypothetical protein